MPRWCCMSIKDDRNRLRHMRDAAQKIIAFTADRDRASLERNELLQLSLVRLIEIIGEAAARISPEIKQRHPEVPWAAIVGMRNRLIHAYFDIDLDVVWNTATVAIPQLLEQIKTILAENNLE